MNLNIKLSKDRMRIWANHAVVEANNERLCCWRSMSDAKKAQTSLKPC